MTLQNIKPTCKPFAALRPRVLAFSVAACFTVAPAFALPTGGQVVAGSVKFNNATPNSLVITNTPGAIINWNNFSVGAIETVKFQQQSSLSSVLNRVTGNTSSSIQGALLSNGRVFLLNPNGILFGAGSKVDVGGLVASTLNISDSDFRKGKLNFQGGENPGTIQNAGTLDAAKNIYLIAPDIENSGILRSAQGEILLAAGRQVSLVDGAHPDIQIVVSAPADKAVNLGDIAAGKISIFAALVQQKGKANADRVEVDEKGRIVFRATKQLDLDAGSQTTANGPTGGSITLQTTEGDTYVKGNVSATAKVGAGGTAQVLGQRVAVMDQASIDVSGETGGGTILVGGDYQGKNAAVQNSTATWFGPDASLKANANTNGDGGKVIVWADDVTRAYGSIEAKGGAKSGNGGFVETSAKFLDVAGIRVDTGDGVWLLDPNDITIGANTNNSTNDASSPLTFTATGASSVVEAVLINNALDSGTSVIVQGDSDITVSTAITKAAGASASLTLRADDDIFVDVPISSSAGTLGVTLTANYSGSAPSGTIVIANSGNISSYGGNVALSGKSISIGGSGGINAGAGNISLTSTVGGVTQTQPISAASLTIDNAGSAILVNTSNAVGSLTASGSGELQFLTTTALNVGSISKSSATVRLTANGGAISQSGTITAGLLDAKSSTSAVTLNGANSVDTFEGKAYGGLAFTNSKAFNVEAVSDYGGVTLTNTGTGNLSTFGDSSGISAPYGNINVTGNLYNASTASITVGRAADPAHTLTVTGNFEQQSGSNLQLYATNTSVYGSVSVTGTATLSGVLSIGGSPSVGTYPFINAGTYSGGFTSITGASGATYNSANGQVTVPTTYTWDAGGGDGLWLTAANWSSDTLPTSSTNVDLAAAAVTLTGGPGNANNLTCSGSCSLTVGGAAGDTLILAGNGTLSSLILNASGSVTGANTKSLTVSNSFTQAANASISGFNYVNLSNAAGLQVGNITTSWSGNYSSGTSGLIRLTTGGGSITQHSGTILTASAVRASSYSGIILEEANPVGVVAGYASSTGDFKFKSTSAINVASVDSLSGIDVPGYAKLTSSYGGTAFTQSAPIVTGSGLLLMGTGTSQSVDLMNSSNKFASIGGTLTSASEVQIMQGVAETLTVNDLESTTGLVLTGATKLKLVNANTSTSYGALVVSEGITVGATAEVGLSAGYGGITLSQPLSAKSITLRADGTINIANTLTASDWVQISNRDTANFSIKASTACSSGACVETDDFANITAPAGIAFGDNDTHVTTGTLYVGAQVDAASFAGGTKPAFIALLGGTSGTIDIAAPMTMSSGGTFVFYGGTVENIGQVLSAPNIAGKASSAELYFNSTHTSIASFSPPTGVAASVTFDGISTTGTQKLVHNSSYDFLNGGGKLAGSSLYIEGGKIGTSATPLQTKTSSLAFTAYGGGGAYIINNSGAPGPLTLGSSFGGAMSSSGPVVITNYGDTSNGITTYNVGGYAVDGYGDVTVISNSPLTVVSGGNIRSQNGSVTLTAASGGALTLNGTVSAPTSGQTVTLAGGSRTGSGTIVTYGGSVAATSYSFTDNTPAAGGGGGGGGSTPPPPTIDACIANPTAAGCSAVLPPLDSCVTNPTAAGCSVVLPPLSSCVTNPTAAGCSVVLPPLDSCVTNPTAAGCSVVLPPLSSCVTTPTAPGCSVVLPPLDTCVTNPTAAGCSVVLPPLSSCVTNPTAPGCSVVLPPNTLPTDQQLACYIDPATCTPGGGTTGTTNPAVVAVIEKIGEAKQIFTLSSQTGLTGSGTVNLDLLPTGNAPGTNLPTAGGGGTPPSQGGGGTPGGTGATQGVSQGATGSPDGSGNKPDEESKPQQTADTSTPPAQGTTNAAPAIKYCN